MLFVQQSHNGTQFMDICVTIIKKLKKNRLNKMRNDGYQQYPNYHQRQQFDHIQQNPPLNYHTQRERNYGNCIIVSWSEDGGPLHTLGPHWYIFMITFIVAVVLAVMMISSLWNTVQAWWLYVIITSTLIFCYSYIRIGFSNPGFAQPLTHVNPIILNNPRYCEVCNTIRSHKVYHCYQCDVCIAGYDHHCPWIGKCVGQKNLCSFYFFLFMCFGTLILFLIATLITNNSRKADPTHPISY